MSDSYFVDWTEFESNRLTLSSIITKQSKEQGKKGESGYKAPTPYQQADFQYLYKLPDGKEIKDNFCIQLCSVKCFGLQVPQGAYSNYQIQAKFDKNNNDVQGCLNAMELVHARMVDLICDRQTNIALKAQNVDADRAKKEGRVFKKLVHYAEDKVTGEIDREKNPTQYFKLSNYENSKTKFLTMDESRKIITIDWNIMEKADFTGRPLIKYTHVYSNSTNVSPQHTVLSMVIEELKSRGSDSAQKITLEKIASQDPDRLKSVASGMSDVLDRLASMGSNNGSKPGALDKNEKKNEALTSQPADLSDWMKNNQNTAPPWKSVV